MRRRTSQLWAVVAGLVALAFLLFAYHPDFTEHTSAGGISAPLAPAPIIESAPAVKLLQSQFKGHLHAHRTVYLSLVFVVVGVLNGFREDPDSRPRHCGPLPRPPPKFS